MKNTEKLLLRFSKKVLIFVLCHITVFSIIMTVIFCVKGVVPDTLIVEHYKYFGLECGALGVIKISENVIEKITQRKDRQNEN